MPEPTTAFEPIRLRPEMELYHRLLAETEIESHMAKADDAGHRTRCRLALLADATRLDRVVLPELFSTFDRLESDFLGGRRVEAFVLHDPTLNAAVMEENESIFLLINSGALNHLDQAELEFLLGHEIGHVVFGHTQFPSEGLLREGCLSPIHCALLRAWQRAAEISADRAGLLFCGSLEVAANSLYKSLTGLRLPGQKIDSHVLAGQLDALFQGIAEEGPQIYWSMSHPFGPLRMRALELFWRHTSGGSTRPPEPLDREIVDLLECTNPFPTWSGTTPDRKLGRFLFWGGLYVALADGHLAAKEVRRIQTVAPPSIDLRRLLSRGGALEERCLEEVRAALKRRKKTLTPIELQRILEGLVLVAKADGRIDYREVIRIHGLAQELDVSSSNCDVILAKFTAKRSSAQPSWERWNSRLA